MTEFFSLNFIFQEVEKPQTHFSKAPIVSRFEILSNWQSLIRA